MKSLFITVTATALLAGSALAQTPSVDPGGVVNVASYAYADLPSGSIAQGSIFGIFGKNLGPTPYAQAGAYPIPTTLGGTVVKITSGSVTANAPIFLASSGQINALLPSNVPVGNATLTVTANGQTSAAASFKVVANSFGTFTLNSGGSGPGAITDTAGKTYGFTSAANPGDVAIIYGTGLGPVQGNEAGGALPGNQPNLPVEVWVGNQKATVSYQGRSGCCAGLDQISFTVPNVTGCRVSLVIKINNTVSNFSTIAVAPKGSRTCSDPGSPSAADLQKFQNQGGAAVGAIVLSRTASSLTVPVLGTVTTNADIGAATFLKYSALQLDLSNNPFNTFTIGSCSVYFYKGGSASSADPVLPKYLDAGAALTVNGPKGTKSLAKTAVAGTISYSGLLTDISANPLSGGGSYLDPGGYSVTGPGGADIGAFNAQMTLGNQLTWANQSSVGDITRASGQLVTWTGGDPNGFVLITGYSSNGSSATSVGAGFSCYANVADGQFTIPANVLLALPPSVSVSGVPTGALLVGSTTTPKPFTAVGLDIGYILSSSNSLKNLNYK